jgi:hypothetical protein
MARCHVRCRKCRARKVLPKRPERYETRPACACGGLYTADKWMNERDTKAMKCGCDGYDFEHHRMGSLKCHFNADGSSKYGEPIELPGIELDF